jgi:hypothetical protein
MLQWFRARARSIAATALLSLATLSVWSAAPHPDDCHESICAVVVPHDPSAHSLGRDTSTTHRPLHCVLCHWKRNGIAMELGLDYIRGTLEDTDEPLPRIPPLRFRGGLRYQRNAFQAGGDVTVAATQDRLVPTETPTDGYQLLRFRNHLSLIKDLTPEMGRNFKVLYNVSF